MFPFISLINVEYTSNFLFSFLTDSRLYFCEGRTGIASVQSVSLNGGGRLYHFRDYLWLYQFFSIAVDGKYIYLSCWRQRCLNYFLAILIVVLLFIHYYALTFRCESDSSSIIFKSLVCGNIKQYLPWL